MAGGMSAWQGENLSQRIANTQARRAKADPVADDTPPTIKHCWYDGPHGRQAALLLDWRRIEDGYDGRIVVAAPEDDGWALVEVWVEGGLLTPI